MHAFRHTLLNRALNVDVDASPITGHAGGKSKVVRGYEGKLWLENLQKILEAIRFEEVTFLKPAKRP
jgi:hypothetical protein